MHREILIDIRDIERLESVERAWHAVTEALRKGNPDFLKLPVTGLQCAVLEINRLQQAEARLRRILSYVEAM